ncbi:MAG: DEAD/DEAH box helicase [Acetobacter sp.]|nr:DEAD/DEAH box helicase [Acetobacter sp.]
MFNHVSEPQGNPKPQRLDLMREKCEELGVAQKNKGSIFEKVSRELLKERDSENSIKNIFLWDEWSHRDGQDTGIDLVVEYNDGTFAAVQCKFYEKNVSLNDVTNFTSKLQSGVRDIRFSKGFLITSSDFSENVYKHVEQIRKTLSVDVINEEDLKKSDIDWEASDFKKNELKLRTKKELRSHQREALERTKEYFEPVERTRGKIIMACGTGKTLTALRIIETLCPKEGKVCFFAPSIALVAQTFREFLKERKEDFIACILCSDHTVGKDDDDLSIAHLPSTPSTNPEAIVKAFEKAKKDKKRLIIFSTYQSSPVLSRAFKENHLQEEFGAFDLMICDEGHRTVGAHTPQEKEKSPFLYCHDDALIPAQKRLYMSATPKVWTSASKAKAKQNNTEMYSMDDPQIYGDVIFSLPFSKAIEQDLLSDYQVMIVALRSDQLGDLTEKVSVQITSQDKRDKHVDRDFVCKILGTYKGLARSDLYILNEENHGKNHQANGENSDEDIPLKPIEHYTPAQRAVLFCRNIKTSKALTKHFGTVIEAYHEEISKEVSEKQNEQNEQREEREAEEIKNKFALTTDHIDGSMNAKERLEKLKKLDYPEEGTCHVLSNARCLSEGVDVPALDSVIFFDPKYAKNDIIQAIGRVLRKAPGKERGFIILPLVIDQHELANLDEAVENTDFTGIWNVLCALRSEDDTLIDETQWKKKIKIAISDPTKQQERDEKDQAQQGDFFQIWQSKMLKKLNDALFNAIPRQFGVEPYWKTFGEKTAKITTTLIERIEHIFTQNPSVKDAYLHALKSAIHPNITETEAVELLASHIVTQPIFKRLFPEGENYPITKALNQALGVLKDHQLDNETKDLRPLYEEVEAQVRNARSENSKQKLIKSLYGTFFKEAFEKQTQRFGIVYTPIEAVNFILRMTRDLTQKHFGKNLNDQGVKIYDPFTGTGSFITQLLNKENHFIDDAHVKRKYEQEIFAQDITLLSYHIAGINISSVIKERVPSIGIFPHLILGDSLNVLERAKIKETPDSLFEGSDPRWAGFNEALHENKQKEEKLDREEINIIIGNPPESAGGGVKMIIMPISPTPC